MSKDSEVNFCAQQFREFLRQEIVQCHIVVGVAPSTIDDIISLRTTAQRDGEMKECLHILT